MNVTSSDSLYCGFQPLSLVTRISSPLMTWSTHLMGRESLCCYMSTLENINLMFRAVLNSFLQISMGRFEPHSWHQLQVSARLSSEMDCQIVSRFYASSRSCIYCSLHARCMHIIHLHACTPCTNCNFLWPMIRDWMKHDVIAATHV